MNASTLTRVVTRPNAAATTSARQPTHKAHTKETRRSEEDRVFEARLRWFLSVSRNA